MALWWQEKCRSLRGPRDIVSIIVTVPISSPTAIVEVPWRYSAANGGDGPIW